MPLFSSTIVLRLCATSGWWQLANPSNDHPHFSAALKCPCCSGGFRTICSFPHRDGEWRNVLEVLFQVRSFQGSRLLTVIAE